MTRLFISLPFGQNAERTGKGEDTVTAGKTATVSFKNILKKSEFRIVKKDAETKKVIEIAGF